MISTLQLWSFFIAASQNKHSGCPSTFYPETPTTLWRLLTAESVSLCGSPSHSGILAWRIPWTEEAGGLQRFGHNSATNTHFFFTLPDLYSSGLVDTIPCLSHRNLKANMLKKNKPYNLLLLPDFPSQEWESCLAPHSAKELLGLPGLSTSRMAPSCRAPAVSPESNLLTDLFIYTLPLHLKINIYLSGCIGS